MKSVKEIERELKGIVSKSQIIMDIRLGRHGLEAELVGNSYVVKDDIAKRYITTRKKISKK